MLTSKHALSKQILTLQHIWIAKTNIFTCLLSFLIEKHKVQRNYITKLSEKAGVTEKKAIYWVFDQVEQIYGGKRLGK